MRLERKRRLGPVNARAARALVALALGILTLGAALAHADITQEGVLRLSVSGKLAPQKLPRSGVAPIAVSVGWKITTSDGSAVPKLKKLRVEINRHGRFDSTGLPVCPVNKIQPASSTHALSVCRSSLVGRGSFTANVSLGGQVSYDTRGRLLVFNAKSHGRSVLLGQIYAPHPFPTSFVITFALEKLAHGTYGTALSATLPKALSNWGNLTGIEMTLSRRFSYGGHSHSYISSGCPAPPGFPGAVFPLARASFSFTEATPLTSVSSATCKASG
jgi:hypothetical protein